MKKTLLAIWKVVKNKYVAATLIFAVFYFFLGENNIGVTHRLGREVSELNRQAAQLERDIKRDSAAAASLASDPDAIETYGREHYYMRRDNEDVFIVKD